MKQGGATNVGGLQLTINDEDGLKKEAREGDRPSQRKSLRVSKSTWCGYC